MVVDVVHAGDARDQALHRVMWPGHPAQQVEDGERDGDDDAEQHVEDKHTGGGGQCQHQP